MPTAAFPRFSFSSRRSRIAAGLGFAALLAAVVYVMAFAGDGDARRNAVADYIRAVNDVERLMVVELRELGTTYQELRLDAKARPEQLDGLGEAERTLASLRSRVAALEPPEEAARLHAELLRLLGLQVEFAGDVTDLARWLPVVTRERAAFARAAQRLRRDLDRARTPRAQTRAFRAYTRRTSAIADRLAELSLPPVLEASRAADEKRLRTLSRLSDRIREALAARRPAVAVRLSQFLAQTAGGTGATRAERVAFRAYNGRLRAIGSAGEAVRRELQRLDLEL
jgi:hypothetical protein